MKQATPRSKKARRALAGERKAALAARDLTYTDLAREAGVSYSMAEKWVNARRTSRECERAFAQLTARAS